MTGSGDPDLEKLLDAFANAVASARDAWWRRAARDLVDDLSNYDKITKARAALVACVRAKVEAERVRMVEAWDRERDLRSIPG